MTLTRRTAIRLFTLAAAAAGVLIVRNIQLMRQNNQNIQKITYSYSRAMEDLATSCDNLSNTLEKELYASSGEMHQNLASKLYREASEAKSALAQLPIEALSLENTYKFLSQVGNYSLSLSKKLEAGEKLTDEEYENLSSLYSFSKELASDMWALENAISSGEINLARAEAKNTESSNPPTVTDGFTDFEGSFDNYPSLIYDGPFSDNILEKEPKMTSEAEEVTREKALQRASMALNINSTDFTKTSDVQGKMPGWRFSDDNASVSCEVTKNGGYISYFLKSRIVENSSLTNESALKEAEKYLDYLGILSMQTTYYEVQGNVMTVNFAYKDIDKCVYTDLVKVSVAMDNGEIMGFDARGYLVNHFERTYPENLYSESKAEEKVSPKLKISSHQLAVIPTDNLEEVLCYEFKCKAENGRNVLVYINAETGNEEQILMLAESESGTLTI